MTAPASPETTAAARRHIQRQQAGGPELIQIIPVGRAARHIGLDKAVEILLRPAGLVVLQVKPAVVIVFAKALGGVRAQGRVDDRVHAEAAEGVALRVAAELLAADKPLAGDNGARRRHGDVQVLKGRAGNADRAVGACLLGVNHGGVDAGRGDAAHQAPGVKGVLLQDKFFRRELGVALPLLSGDAPAVRQVGPQHVLHGHIGKTQGGGVISRRLHVQGVVLKEEPALLQGLPEAAADLGIAGVGNVGDVDRLDASGPDQHVDVAAGGPALHIQVPSI